MRSVQLIRFVFQINAEEREDLLKNVWKPDESFHFPSKVFGKRKLKFQYSWFQNREWLVYSKNLDGAFCKYCFLFSSGVAGKQGLPLGKLVRVAHSDWRHALEDFNKHQLTTYHANCKLDAENFLAIRAGQRSNIVCNIDKGVSEKIAENRRLLTPVIKTVLFCGRQGLPLRGHRDGGPINTNQEVVLNEGNFRALLRMRVESGDTTLKEHLENATKNATYTSSVAQNDIIHACNNVMLNKLVTRVNNARCFSIIADETTDIACTEQLTLCARYVDLETVSIREDFLQFVPIYDMTGKGISDVIMRKLREIGINTEYIYGQGYDGASSMSGVYNGVQKFVKNEAPNALYVHCSSHSLNLAIFDACSLRVIRNCMGTIGKVYGFFNTPKRQAVLTKFSENCSKKLKQLSPTRWIQRHNSVNVFCELYNAIVRALEEICSWTDKDTATNANLIYSEITKCDFLTALITIRAVFSYTLPLTKYLESEEIDLSNAVNFAENTVSEIQNLRDKAEAEFSEIFKMVEVICVNEDIPVNVPRMCNRQTGRENFPHDTPETYFRRSTFIPFIDHFITQINERFISHKEILSSFEILLHGKADNRNDKVEVLYSQYGNAIEAIDSCQLNGEIKIWHQRLEAVEIEREETFKKNQKAIKKITAIEALTHCNRIMYPSVFKLLQIMATLPVTSCSAERSFSTLRYLKNYLRNTTGETRLNGLSLLYVHKDILVSPAEILDEMAKKSRRIQL